MSRIYSNNEDKVDHVCFKDLIPDEIIQVFDGIEISEEFKDKTIFEPQDAWKGLTVQ